MITSDLINHAFFGFLVWIWIMFNGSLDDDHGSYGTISYDASSSNFETVLTSSPKYFLGLQNTILSPHSKSNPNTTPHHSKVTIDSFLATKFSPQGIIWYTTQPTNPYITPLHHQANLIYARIYSFLLELGQFSWILIVKKRWIL